MRARKWILPLMLVTLLLSLTVWSAAPSARADRDAPTGGGATAPLFVENRGQFAAGARYQLRGNDGTLWLAPDALWLTLLSNTSELPSPARPRNGASAERENPRAPTGAHLRLTFPGANPAPQMEGLLRADAAISYLQGSDPQAWRQNVPAWEGVRYRDLYPGIDLELRSEGGQLLPRLIVREPEALAQVRLRVEGAEAMSFVERDGAPVGLRLTTAGGDVLLPLFALYDGAGRALPLPALPARAGNEIVHPFGLYAADAPSEQGGGLLYSTFLGGGVAERAYDVAVDNNGNAYLVGTTLSTDFPTTSGAFDETPNGNIDLFVTKLNSNGNALVYSTYLGGGNIDEGYSIALDGAGNAYVTGMTYSANFPTTAGAYDTTFNGSYDAFVTKLNAAGSALVYSTYLGSTHEDLAHMVAVDGSGHVYVTGRASGAGFPTTAGAYDTTHNGLYDGFVTKLAPDGAALLYSTYLGASADEIAYAVAVDAGGAASISGYTFSPTFPTTPGAYDTTHNGSVDAFAARLNATGSAFQYSTFLGGGGNDIAESIAIDYAGSVYLTGYTDSDNFPTSPGAYDSTHAMLYDTFVSKLTPDGAQLTYSTYLGGDEDDAGYEILVDTSQYAYIAGESASATYPTTANAYDPTHNGMQDAMLTIVNADGSALMYSTFLGSNFQEVARGVALDNGGSPYLAGWTNSPAFPTTAGAYDPTQNGDDDAFAAKFEVIVPPVATPTPTATPPASATPTLTPSVTPTATGSATVTATTTPSPTSSATVTPTATGSATVIATATPSATATATASATITVTPSVTVSATTTPQERMLYLPLIQREVSAAP